MRKRKPSSKSPASGDTRLFRRKASEFNVLSVSNEAELQDASTAESEDLSSSSFNFSPYDAIISMTQEESADNVLWVEQEPLEQLREDEEPAHNHNKSSGRKTPSIFSLGTVQPPPRRSKSMQMQSQRKLGKKRDTSRKPLHTTSLNELIGILDVSDQKKSFEITGKENCIQFSASKPPKRPPVPAFNADSPPVPTDSVLSSLTSNSSNVSEISKVGVSGIAIPGDESTSPQLSHSETGRSVSCDGTSTITVSSEVATNSGVIDTHSVASPSSRACRPEKEIELTDDDLRIIDMAVHEELSQSCSCPSSQRIDNHNAPTVDHKLLHRSKTAPSILRSPPPPSVATEAVHHDHNKSSEVSSSLSGNPASFSTYEMDKNDGDLDGDIVMSDDLLAMIESIERSADLEQQINIPASSTAVLPSLTKANLQPVQPHPDLIQCIQFIAVDVEVDQRSQTKKVRAHQKDSYTKTGNDAATVTAPTYSCVVVLEDDWFYTEIKAGDVFNVVDLSLDIKYHQQGPTALHYDQSRTSGSIFNSLLRGTAPDENAAHEQMPHVVVNGSRGLLIVHPQVFVTPTKVAESCTCVRRGVLTDRYRSYGDINAAAVMGNLKHSFMEILTEQLLVLLHGMKLESSKDLLIVRQKLSGATLRNIIGRCIAQHLVELYVVGFNDADIEKELLSLVEPTIRWVWICYTQSLRNLIAANHHDHKQQQQQQAHNQTPGMVTTHCHNKSTHARRDTSSSELNALDGVDYQIQKLSSMEETIWSSILGMRGQIDLVSQSKMRFVQKVGTQMQSNVIEHIFLPIEFKTGKWRPSTVVAHRAQIMLYVLMLMVRERGGSRLLAYSNQVSTNKVPQRQLPPQPIHGIIIYINDQETKLDIVKPNWIEVKALMISRNRLAHSMKQAHDFETKVNDSDSALPAMIKSQFDCKHCYQAAECITHHLVHEDGSSQSSGVDDVFNYIVRGMGPKDIQYMNHWEHLINLEANAIQRKVLKKNCSRMSIDKRPHSDQYIGGLQFLSCKPNPDSLQLNDFLLCLSLQTNSHVSGCLDILHEYQLGDRISVSVEVNNEKMKELFLNKKLQEVLQSNDVKIPSSRSSCHGALADIEDLGISDSIKDIENSAVSLSSRSIMTKELNIITGKLHSLEASQGMESRKEVVIQLDIEGKPYTLFQLIQCFPDAKELNDNLSFRLAKDDLSVNIATMRSNLLLLFTQPYHPKTFEESTQSGSIASLNDEHSISRKWKELIVSLRPPQYNVGVEATDLMMLMRPKRINEIQFRKSLQALHSFLNKNPQLPNVHRGMHGEIVITSSNLTVYPGCNPLLLAKEMVAMNSGQQQAIIRIICCEDYSLLLGLPGTGKTSVLALVIRMLIAREERILLTSFTHSAVDHLLEKLTQAGMTTAHITRVGVSAHADAKLKAFTLDTDQIKTIEKMKEICTIRSRLFACTTYAASRSPLIKSMKFDFCIVDEAGQIAQPIVLGALMRARKAVFVGDIYQLPPLVISKEAQRLGMGESLLKRLCDAHPNAVNTLSSQYRMNQDIVAVSNELIYENKMTCGSSLVASARLQLPLPQHLASDAWLGSALQPSPAVVIVNTDPLISRVDSTNDKVDPNGRESEVEAELIRRLIDALQRCGFELNEVGILTPFRDQVELIKQKLKTHIHIPGQSTTSGHNRMNCSDISTVDKFQGKDKQVILLSMVRILKEISGSSTREPKERDHGELLQDWRRINVAITRAKVKLIIIGSISFMMSVSQLQALVTHIQCNSRNGIINAK